MGLSYDMDMDCKILVNIMEQCHDMYCRDASKDLMGEFHHMYICRHAEIGENLKRQSQNMYACKHA